MWNNFYISPVVGSVRAWFVISVLWGCNVAHFRWEEFTWTDAVALHWELYRGVGVCQSLPDSSSRSVNLPLYIYDWSLLMAVRHIRVMIYRLLSSVWSLGSRVQHSWRLKASKVCLAVSRSLTGYAVQLLWLCVINSLVTNNRMSVGNSA